MKYLLLIILTCISALLYTYRLDAIPNGLNRDEAALGYNAYLLKSTGKDEWGKQWPLTLRSFGDYKLAGAVYTMIPFWYLFGFSNQTVRLPIALAGIALVPLSFFLGRAFKLSIFSSLFVAFLVATSPVFFFFSRFGFEAILALALFLTSLILWLSKRGGRKRLFLDIAGLIAYSYAAFTYNTPLLLLPVAILLVISSRGIFAFKRWLPLSIALVLISLGVAFLLRDATASKQGISIFSDATIISQYPVYRESFSGISQQLIGNQYVYYLKLIIMRLSLFFSADFLVMRGGSHPWHQLPGFGHLLWSTYLVILGGILVAVGVLCLHWSALVDHSYLKNNLLSSPPHRYAVLLVVLIYSLLIPSITTDAPHATRSLFVFIVLFLLGGAMIDTIRSLLAKRKAIPVGAILLGVFFVTTAIFWVLYLSNYFSSYQQASAVILKSHLVKSVATAGVSNPQIVDPDGYEYIRTAWDLQIPADVFLKTIQRGEATPLGFSPGRQVGTYQFLEHEQTEAKNDQQTIFIWKDTAWHTL